MLATFKVFGGSLFFVHGLQINAILYNVQFRSLSCPDCHATSNQYFSPSFSETCCELVASGYWTNARQFEQSIPNLVLDRRQISEATCSLSSFSLHVLIWVFLFLKSLSLRRPVPQPTRLRPEPDQGLDHKRPLRSRLPSTEVELWNHYQCFKCSQHLRFLEDLCFSSIGSYLI